MIQSKGPKITIITACYNSEETIEQTIQSVLNQTYDNIEYIVIDGASIDSTMEIVEKYRSRIDIVISEKDDGVYDAFNKGVSLATGDYVNFMNADDYFYSNSIVEEIAVHLLLHPNIRMFHGNVKAFDEKSGHWHFRGQGLGLMDFEKGRMCPHQSVFTHKKLFEEFEGFDLNYKILADVDFTIKCFKKYEKSIEYLPIEIAHFRLGGLSNAPQHEKQMHLENAIIHFNHFGNIPDYTKSVVSSFETYHINQTYQLWLEHFLIGEKGILDSFKAQNIAIFGTKKNATFLYHGLRRSGANVVCFLDNDVRMQNQMLHGKPIISPRIMNEKEVGAILISVERYDGAQSVKQQLKHQYGNTPLYTWHELF